MNFEKDLDRYTLAVVRDLLICKVCMLLLSSLLFLLKLEDYYYFITCFLFLSSVTLFLVLKRKKQQKCSLLKMYTISIPFLLLALLLVDDFFFSIKPLVYLFFAFFIIEVIRMGFLIHNYLNMILKKHKEYRIVTNFENRGNLLGKVSRSLLHDIATPVSILSGSYELLERSNLNKKEYDIFLSNVKIAVDQLNVILHSTDFLMKESSLYTSFSFDECIEEIVALLKSRIDTASIVIERRYGKTVSVDGDRNIFLRIFLNIFLNAIEELEKRDRDVKRICIGLASTPKYICVSVVDNGEGIDSRVKEMLNSEGFVMSEKTDDIGSGLFFVKYCMREVFGGKIRIDNNVKEKRNSVRLYFPRD